MIIAFDTFMLSDRFRRVGIFQYAKNLFFEFRRIVEEDESIKIRYFVGDGLSHEIVQAETVEGLEPVRTDWMRYSWLWRLGSANYAAARVRADLLFSPAPKIVPLARIPVAVTIHDAIPSQFRPEVIGKWTAYALRAENLIGAKLADKILTDSYRSKQDLIDLYQLDPGKISVVYLGYDKTVFHSQADSEDVRPLLQRLGILRPYIIHHGMVQTRKNLTRLIDAYSRLLNQSSYRDVELVLAGEMGLGSDEIQRAAAGLKRGRVIFTGSLSDQELGLLIRGAQLAVIPSLYEGFCLPLVESMASGVPTVGSNSSCIPEISGGVLRYFDPLSEEDISNTIAYVLDHKDVRDILKRNGLERAAAFSWRRCALETLAALTGSKVAVARTASVAGESPATACLGKHPR